MSEKQSDTTCKNNIWVYIIGEKYNPEDSLFILYAGTNNVINYKCVLS